MIRLPQCLFYIFQQLLAVLSVDPRVAGDAQQSEPHVKGNSTGNGCEGLVPVGKMAGILPEEVTDEGLRRPMVVRVLHEEMLDLAGYPAYVEDPIKPASSAPGR